MSKKLTIKELRERKGKTPEQTARAIKTSIKRYKQIEDGAIDKLKVLEFIQLTDFLKATTEERKQLIESL